MTLVLFVVERHQRPRGSSDWDAQAERGYPSGSVTVQVSEEQRSPKINTYMSFLEVS